MQEAEQLGLDQSRLFWKPVKGSGSREKHESRSTAGSRKCWSITTTSSKGAKRAASYGDTWRK
jgi:hypothetical protein